jgi:hypothetical protein
MLLQFLILLFSELSFNEGFIRVPRKNVPHAMKLRSIKNEAGLNVKSKPKELFEGNPIGKMLWDWVWTKDFMKPSLTGTSPTQFGDAATVLKNNIEQVIILLYYYKQSIYMMIISLNLICTMCRYTEARNQSTVRP